jgi:hypothetical protein
MSKDDEKPYAAQGRRLRWLRLAMQIPTQKAFAEYVGWGDNQSGLSQFETGDRPVPAQKALQIRKKIPDFDPIWLWEGDMGGIPPRLRKLIEAEEAKEMTTQSARDER